VPGLDLPVPADPVGQLRRGGQAEGQAGDGPLHTTPPFPAGQRPGSAGHPQSLRGVREGRPGGDGDSLQRALFLLAVAAVVMGGGRGPVFHGSFRRWACRPGWSPLTTRMQSDFLSATTHMILETEPVPCLSRRTAHHVINRPSRHHAEALPSAGTSVLTDCWSEAADASRCALFAPTLVCESGRANHAMIDCGPGAATPRPRSLGDAHSQTSPTSARQKCCAKRH